MPNDDITILTNLIPPDRVTGPNYEAILVTNATTENEEHICIRLEGTGIGGKNIHDLQAVPYEIFKNQPLETRQDIINHPKYVVEPPIEWATAIKDLITDFATNPPANTIKEHYTQHQDYEYELEKYHNISNPRQHPINESINVITNPVQPGLIYLCRSSGEAQVLSYPKDGSSFGWRITKIEYTTINPDEINLVQPDTAAKLQQSHLQSISQNDKTVWVQLANHKLLPYANGFKTAIESPADIERMEHYATQI